MAGGFNLRAVPALMANEDGVVPPRYDASILRCNVSQGGLWPSLVQPPHLREGWPTPLADLLTLLNFLFPSLLTRVFRVAFGPLGMLHVVTFLA